MAQTFDSLQIQSVIYHNPKVDIIRTMDHIYNALAVTKKQGVGIGQVVVYYGDASSQPVFEESEITEMKQKYSDYFDFQYTFFGFNSGTSKGHNLLAAQSSSNYLLLMNPDIIVCPRFFLYMAQPFAQPDVAMVEARQTPIEHPKAYNLKTGEVDWASGACGIVKTAVFREVGGYDEKNFFLYCDDVDLSWRIRLKGYRLIYQPLAPVFHSKSLSAKGAWEPTQAELYYSAESALLMAHKWSNPKLCKKLLHSLLHSDSEISVKAANAFLAKKEANDLPEPLDPEHKVAKFIKGNYTKHRFTL